MFVLFLLYKFDFNSRFSLIMMAYAYAYFNMRCIFALISALPLYFAGIDEDVFSMNASVASNDFCVFGDTTLIPQIVHAICRLASAVNISWTEITCAGRGAVDVYRLMSELGYVLPKSPSNLLSTDPSPCSLILFDRRVDLVRRFELISYNIVFV